MAAVRAHSSRERCRLHMQALHACPYFATHQAEQLGAGPGGAVAVLHGGGMLGRQRTFHCL